MSDCRTVYSIYRTNLVLGLLALAGIVQFMVAVVWATTRSGDDVLFQQLLSDFGGARAHGRDNSAVADVYNTALIILGCSLMPLFIVMPSMLPSHQSLIRNAGVITALGIVGLGVTPYDVAPIRHNIALVMWIGGISNLAFALAVTFGFHGASGTCVMLATIALFMAIGAYVFAQTIHDRVIYQKVVVLAAAFWTLTVVVAVSFFTHRVVKSPRDKERDRQACNYLQQVELHGWRKNKDS